MDDTLQIMLIAFIIVIGAPWVASRRAKRKRKKRIENSGIVVICPHCETENALERIRNFVCHNCKNTVAFFKNFKTEEPMDNLKNDKMFKL